MSGRAYARLRRYAALSILNAFVVVAAVAGLAGDAAQLVVLIASVPLLMAWGPYQADIALNPVLDGTARTRWRIVVWCLPWSITLYWHRYIRPRRVID